MMRRLLAIAIAAAALLLAAAPASAGDWVPQAIVGPPGTTWVQPNAINIHGVVVGVAKFPGRSEQTAFRWEDGHMIELENGGARSSQAYDINDRGVIVGAVNHTNGAVWTATRTTSSLALTAFNISGRHGSLAFGINESGQIVGTAGDTGNMPAPFERSTYENRFPAMTTGGGWTRIMIPPTYEETETTRRVTVTGGDAIQINENGVVLGGMANLGSVARIGTTGELPNQTLEMVAGNQGLNDAGQVAGRDLGPMRGPFFARVWSGGSYIDIGRDQEKSRANAINNQGWVVGRVGTEDYQPEYRILGDAWLWRLDGAAEPLYRLGPTGWSFANARDINDNGVIVGVGRQGTVDVGFMLTPSGIAFRLSGTVVGVDGRPVNGARVQVVNEGGVDVTPTLTTGADGRYDTTLNRARYKITVLPAGAYAPNAGAGCQIEGTTCGLALNENRVVDFFGIGAPKDIRPPTFRGPKRNAPVTATRTGSVALTLGPFSEAATGTVALQLAGKARAAAKAKPRTTRRAKKRAAPVVLGKRSFKVATGKRITVKVTLNKAASKLLKQRGRLKAVAVVTARDKAGNATTKRFTVTIRAASPRRARR